MFERLNRKGTRLSDLELAYSMIKAYWPEFEPVIRDIKERLMPEAHLATLVARMALSPHGNNGLKLEGPVSIARLRRIATEKIESASEAKAIRQAFSQEYLQKILAIVNYWLLHQHVGDYGLPPVLRTSIAVSTPDVFLLLMLMARQILKDHDQDIAVAKQKADTVRREVLALASVLRWFSVDAGKAVRRLVATGILDRELTPAAFDSILADKEISQHILQIQSPAELERIMRIDQVDDDEQVKRWRWRDRFIVNACDADEALSPDAQEGYILREKNLLQFLDRLLSNKHDIRYLLLYAQRNYLHRQFKNYDPADSDQWEMHNRPWDFDHILPSAVFYENTRSFRDACREWSGSIGNLRAWPLEKNRSRQDENASSTITSQQDLCDSLLDGTQNECQAFSLSFNDVEKNREKVVEFMNAARNRLLRIYAEWYNALSVEQLIRPTTVR